MFSATYSGRRMILGALALVLCTSVPAEMKTITIKVKPGDTKTYTSVKIRKNNGGMTISAPGCTVAGPAAGATGTWQLTGCTLSAGSPLTITFNNPNGTVNYRLGGYDYQDANGRTVWVGVCTDPIAFRVVEGGPLGTSYLGYPIPANEFGYFYQMFPNGVNPETVQSARIHLGANNGAYNFQVLNNSFQHLSDPGFDLNDLEVPLRDPPDGYEYEVVEYMEPADATGSPGIPTLWSYDAPTNTATMDFSDAPGGGLSLGQTGSIVAYTSPYQPTMLLDNVDVAYQGGVDPPCTGLFVNEAPVPMAPPQFSFQPLPELPGGASILLAGDRLEVYFDPAYSYCGKSLDDDGIWKAVMWRKDPLTTFLFSIQVLPNPFGDTESQASSIHCFVDIAVNFNDIFCSIGGSADNLGGLPQPVVWQVEDQWPCAGDCAVTAELAPLPPGFDSGEIQACVNVDQILRYVGFVIAGSGPRHAIAWERDRVSGTWTFEFLPDNGPDLPSEATCLTHDNIFEDDVHIGGASGTDSSPEAPCVWQGIPGGGFERTDLALTPGTYRGAVTGVFSDLDNDTGAIDFVRWGAVGYGAAIAGLADLYRATFWPKTADGWGPPAQLLPIPGIRDSRASGVAVGRSGQRDGFSIAGHSYIETSPGTERATLWEVSPDDSIATFDVNDLTTDLPLGVTLGGWLIGDGLDAPAGCTGAACPGGNGGFMWGAGTHSHVDSPGVPHANLLLQLSGEDCNANGMDDAIDLYWGTSGDTNANGVPDECELVFKYEALEGLPGGQSIVMGSNTGGDRLIEWQGYCGQSLDGDGIWKPVVWLFYPGCLPFEGSLFMVEPLPLNPLLDPFGLLGGAALTVEIDRDLYPDAWVYAAGYVDVTDNEEVWNHPAFWVREGDGTWTAELPAPPPPFDSGAILAMDKAELVDLILKNRMCGWVGQKEGPEPHHAVACDMVDDGGGWVPLWSPLPDYGPGFFSEAASIIIDPVDAGDPTDDLRIIGGSLQTDTSPQAPCVWQEVPGGAFELIELPMLPGAYLGAITGCAGGKNEDNAWETCTGHNALPGGIDFYRPVLHQRTAGLWSAPLELPPLFGYRDARATSVAAGTSKAGNGTTVIGYSYSETAPTGAVRHTLWEIEPDNTITTYDLNDVTVNLPPDVALAGAPLALTIAIDTTLAAAAGGTHADGSGLQGYSLQRVRSGNCCRQNSQGEPVCGPIPDIMECRLIYQGYPVDNCDQCLCCAPPDLLPEPSLTLKNRYISIIVPPEGAGDETSIRVELTSLHHPAGPPNAPNFTAFEGQYRYLNAIRDGANNPVYVCPDSPGAGTTFACAKLGCAPEYRDWAGIFGGAVVHVTGDSVVPSSQYAVAQLAASCIGNETSCTAISAELVVTTERWGNVDGSPVGGAPAALDIGRVVDKVRDLPGAFTKSRCQLREGTPNPYAFAVNAQDIARIVDAVKGQPYPFTISVCP